jgi:isopropylmalate/homocitrate/citramalate synthase
MAFGCPFEGAVPPEKVLEVAAQLLDLGCDEISVGDTIGVATPREVEAVLTPLLRHIPADRLAVHYHDTRGTALANVLSSLQLGVSIIDASSGGLGGCPFAPGAAGNLATEDLLYMLHGLGIETGVDLDRVVAASRFILAKLGRPGGSKYLQACGATGTVE